MLIYILDSQMRKIGMLRKYTFVQYTDMARDIGTFTINARIVKENLFLLDKNKKFYVLFDNRIVGKVTNVTRDSDSEYEKVITITGKLALTFFEKRVIAGTIKYKGYTYDYARQLVQTQITNDTTSKRYLKIDVSVGNETEETKLKEICSTVDKQVTGGYVWDEMYAALEQDSLVVFFTPKGGTLVADSVNGVKEWSLLISSGVNRTKGNADGNVPVVFSQSLSNIARTTYIIDNTYHRNVAYVAGEGEEADRKWFELFSSADAQNASGWDREELWVDARDVQSENEDGSVMSDEEYEQAITERANEKFSENRMSESYEATITNANNQYTYGVDYNKGDWVTVVDDELKISIDVQITEVTKSVEGDREIVDIGFTYGAIKRRDSENSEYVSGKLEQVANDVKYIENKVKKNEIKRASLNDIFYKDGYDCFLHTLGNSASDVVKTLSPAYRPIKAVVASGFCYNTNSKGWYPCVAGIRPDGTWAYVSAINELGQSALYYIYNQSQNIDRRSYFQLWITGAWSTKVNGG